MHWKNIEGIEKKTQDRKKHPLCSSTNKLCINDGNNQCNFVGRNKLKPIYYDTLFQHKVPSYTIKESIGSIKISKKKNNDSTASSTSVRNISNEVSGRILAVNEPQENESNYDAMSIEQSSLS